MAAAELEYKDAVCPICLEHCRNLDRHNHRQHPSVHFLNEAGSERRRRLPTNRYLDISQCPNCGLFVENKWYEAHVKGAHPEDPGQITAAIAVLGDGPTAHGDDGAGDDGAATFMEHGDWEDQGVFSTDYVDDECAFASGANWMLNRDGDIDFNSNEIIGEVFVAPFKSSAVQLQPLAVRAKNWRNYARWPAVRAEGCNVELYCIDTNEKFVMASGSPPRARAKLTGGSTRRGPASGTFTVRVERDELETFGSHLAHADVNANTGDLSACEICSE